MKLHVRFTLGFVAVVLVMAGFLSFYIGGVLTSRVRNEKAEEYSRSLKQLATSVYLITRETEQTLFNQYSGQDLAGALLAEQEALAKTLNVQNMLAAVPLNVTGMMSILAEDTEGKRYFSGKIPEYRSSVIEAVLTDEVYDTFTLWLSDGEGHIFLKKDVYRVFPLKYAGIVAVQLDADLFMSSVGMDALSEGMCAVITEQGRPLARHGGLTDAALEEALAQESLSYRPVSREITLSDGTYWLTMQPAVNQSWYTLQLVPVNVMLAMPVSLSRVIRIGCLIIVAVAFLLNALLAHSMTRRVKKLLNSMTEVSRGNFDTPISVTGRDEIGELADRFRWMQAELKAVTEKMVLRATEKQQAEYGMLELKYRSLLAQVSPHFLCNVLSTINALAVMGKTRDVSALAVKAARYLRDNLNSSDQKFTTLGQEIHFVEEYVELYREAYSYACRFELDVSDEAVECRVPNMLLQPLVENALVHGAESGERLHHIRISAGAEGEELVIRVANDGQGISPEIVAMVERAGADGEFSKKMKGFGLRGVLQRLRLLYGESQSLRIESGPGEWTCITIRIPYEHEN